MTSKSCFIFALFFPLTVALPSAQAETYQWKDSNGQTVVSDYPPPSTAKGRRSIGGVKPTVVSEALPEKIADTPKIPEAPKNIAEKDLEFKKRQQESREKADKQAKEQAAQKDKSENCDRARRNLVAVGADGERSAMDAAQRALEIERARKLLAESCQ